MRENTKIPAHRSFHLGFNHYSKSGAHQSIFLHAPSTHGLHPLQFYTRPQRGLRSHSLFFSFTEGEGSRRQRGAAPPRCPQAPVPLGTGFPARHRHPPRGLRCHDPWKQQSRPSSKFCGQSLPAIIPFLQQPAQKQQLQTPTGLTEVKTHRVLLFRQTQITASSADCSRDEQTHINYRLTSQFTSQKHETSAQLL